MTASAISEEARERANRIRDGKDVSDAELRSVWAGIFLDIQELKTRCPACWGKPAFSSRQEFIRQLAPYVCITACVVSICLCVVLSVLTKNGQGEAVAGIVGKTADAAVQKATK